MDVTKIPQRQPDYQLEILDDEILLFHPSQEQILYCNQTASLVWNLCDGQRTTQAIIDLLTEAYPEAAESVQRDTLSTLELFERHAAIKFN